jgi:hypothetical protein
LALKDKKRIDNQNKLTKEELRIIAESEADIKAGRYKTFKTAKELVADLQKEERR